MKFHEDNEESEKEAEHEDTSHKRMSCKGCMDDGHRRNHSKHGRREHVKMRVEGIKRAMEKASK